VVFPAGAVVLALAFVNAAVTDALATRIAAEADQAVIRALYDVQAFAITFTAFPIAALVGAVTVASSRTRLLPPLVTRLGLLLVPPGSSAAAQCSSRRAPSRRLARSASSSCSCGWRGSSP
jgi:hypothetical protein